MTPAHIAEKLATLQPLAGLAAQSRDGLAPLCLIDRVPRSSDLRALCDWNDQMVWLLAGELMVESAEEGVEVLVGGCGDALLPMGRGGSLPRRARTITEVELLRIDADAVDIAVTWGQDALAPAVTGSSAEWGSLSGKFAAQSLAGSAFAALPPAHFNAVLERCQRIEVKRGAVMIRQGDAGDYYYVIERGRCSVTREVGGAIIELAELQGGDAFGEEALIAGTVRNATVTMKTDGILLRLGQTDFTALLQEPLLQRVTPSIARARVAAGATWLDVRFPSEYHHDGLRGAVNLPLNEMRQALPMLDKHSEFIVYCQSGRRSSAAAFLLSQRGFRASLLDGGLRAFHADKDSA
jgi:rhodanese-related sulfurtransferase